MESFNALKNYSHFDFFLFTAFENNLELIEYVKMPLLYGVHCERFYHSLRSMYHHQQNKYYLQWCLLGEATVDFRPLKCQSLHSKCLHLEMQLTLSRLTFQCILFQPLGRAHTESTRHESTRFPLPSTPFYHRSVSRA